MGTRLRTLRQDLSQSLMFLPTCLVVLFAAAAVVLTQVDEGLDREAISWAFSGDESAARTLLSVVAGSLITVAGLTLSITIVVLQLASSQFSPRVLRTFFGDRVTQLTIGTFVGTFVYALLVLRSVGSVADGGVPRLSTTVATVLAVAAVSLLIVFLNHVARLIQVSHVAAELARQTQARFESLYPQRVGTAVDEDAAALVSEWRRDPPGRVDAQEIGFVRRVAVEALLRTARAAGAERVALLARPGDFVASGALLAEVWPAAVAEQCGQAVRDAVVIGDERDLQDDAGFGLRQLGDIAIKALSPGINDPATAVTCIGYLRSLLVLLAEREAVGAVRRAEDLTVIVAIRGFDEDLDVLVQISRYVAGDAWVAVELLDALGACAHAAHEAGAADRVQHAVKLARVIGEWAAQAAGTSHDAASIARATERACDPCGPRPVSGVSA